MQKKDWERERVRFDSRPDSMLEHGGVGAHANGGQGYQGAWDDAVYIPCADGKARPIKPGIEPLVDGLPKSLVRGGDTSMAPDADNSAEARAMRLKGYGNAIVPQVAATFVKSVMDVLGLG